MITTTPVFCAFLLSLLAASPSHGYSSSQQQNRKAPAAATEINQHNDNNNMMMSRRGVLRALSTVAVGTMVAQPAKGAMAAEGDVDTPVYFGVGCFWHIQHEFVDGEKTILGRDIHQFTSAAGYAGGKSADKEGRVCYHNFQGVADYGKLGHGEVVGMNIPQSKIGDFSKLYFSLFNPKTKDRVDPGDRGGEYRSLIGLPGGVKHTSFPEVQDAATNAGFTLVEGKGNEGDTFGKQIVYVYDSNQFPFYQGEVYHQYHNDFQSPPYGKEYNKLADLALDEGRIHTTGCPDRI
mmetsp:Transcript_54188/g.131488  ORF Transcript_54188/g.131488 Transcript_54188/m.131488 type:complete len:292 (-) Transcript_54188:134-1009(-)